MKKILLAFIAMMAFAACSKNDSTPNNRSSIIGKWQHTMAVYHDMPNGFPAKQDTFMYPAGSYSDFRTDGNIYDYQNSNPPSYDTASYIVQGSVIFLTSYVSDQNGNRVLFQDTANIEILSAHNLKLHAITYDSTGEYEEWDYLTR